MKTKTDINNIIETVQSRFTNTIELDKVAIEADYNDDYSNQSSIAIKILSVIGGFMATLAFLGFLLLSRLHNSEIGLLTLGIIFIVISILLNRKSDKLITDTFSISTYVVGIFLIVFAFGEMDFDENFVAIIIMLIALVSLYLTQNYILSFISVLVITSSLLALLVFLNNTYNLIHVYNTIIVLSMTYMFLFEARIISISKKLSKLYNPLRIGLIISYLFGLGILRTRKLLDLEINYVWFYSIVLFGILLYVISKILKIMKVDNKSSILIYILSALILGITVFSPSILGAILLILLGFYVNHKFSLVIGIIALIYFVSQYYYDLNYTLLTKSIMLIISGVLFIIFYLFTTKSIENEKV